MTTTFSPGAAPVRSWQPFAAAGVGTALVLTALGTFADFNGNDSGGTGGVGDYLPVVGVIAVAAAIVYAVVAHRPTPVTTLVLGVLAVLSVAVAWSGLPAVLASGALASGLIAERRTPLSWVGVGLALLGLVGAVAFAIVG